MAGTHWSPGYGPDTARGSSAVSRERQRGEIGPRKRSHGARPESSARNWALSIGSLLLTFCGIEVLLGIVPLAMPRVLTPSDRQLTVALDCYPSNPRGYFDLDLREPEVRERFEALRVRRLQDCAAKAPHAIELRYNSLQFRDREPGPRRPGVRRVIVLGDSFTEGQGVKEPHVYPRALETALNARGEERWEVLNFGHRGADFPALQDTFEQLLRFDPDLVIYGMMLNDCELSSSFRDRDPLLSDWLTGRGRQGSTANMQPLGLRTAWFVRQRMERLRIHRGTSAWYHDLYSEPNHEGWTRTQAHIRGMSRRMRLRGGHFLLATWPVLSDLEGGYALQHVHETVGRFSRNAGITWLDLLPALQGRPSASLWVHPLDHHPNELAHRLVADDIAPVVEALAGAGGD